MKSTRVAALILMLGMSGATMVQQWNYRVIRGKSCVLECNDTRRNGTYDNMQDFSWIFPDLTTHTDKYSDGNVFVEGMTVRISSLNESLEGIYHCQYHIMNGTEKIPQIVKRGINYGGPAYETSLDEYASDLVAGFVAVIVLLVTTTVLCLVYKYYPKMKVVRVGVKGETTGVHYGSDQETHLGVDNAALDMPDSKRGGESVRPDEQKHIDSVRPEQYRKASKVLGVQHLPKSVDDAQNGTKSATGYGVDNPALDGDEPHKEITQPEELRKSPEILVEKDLPKPQTDAAVLMVSSL